MFEPLIACVLISDQVGEAVKPSSVEDVALETLL